jgi:hypothetical protein
MSGTWERLEDAVMLGPPFNDPLVVLILACAAVITIGALVTALSRFRRTEFVKLQNEMKEVAERVKVLEATEQRRFIRELNNRGTDKEAEQAINGSGRSELKSLVQ